MAEEIQKEHYLLSKRDDAEMNRLNFQHDLIIKIQENKILDSIIPKQNVKMVADVGTGTGLWLEALTAELERSGNHDFELTGFDISSVLFPKTPQPRVRFVVSDVLQGFDEIYFEKFDVVHIRLFGLVLKIEQIQPAVENIMKLLKPSGYIQWEDFDFGHVLKDGIVDPTLLNSCPDGTPDLCREESLMMTDFIQSQGWSLEMLTEVSKALQNCSVTDLRRINYTDVIRQRPELHEPAREWHKLSFRALLPPMYIRMGKASSYEEAGNMLQEYYARVDEMIMHGYVFTMPLVCVVARKT